MADEPREDEATPAGVGADGAEGEGTAPKKQRLVLNRKSALMLGVPALLLFIGGGYFAVEASGFIGGGKPAEAMKDQKLYLDLPEMVVNLSGPENRIQYLKIKVALEAGDKATLDALNPVMPRILDAFQLYLRELRTTDLDGSAGIFRLKEELLRRINVEVHPHEVNRVLFKEIIVQ